MKKIIIILLFIVVAISVAGNYFIRQQRDKKQENSDQSQSQPEQKTEVKPETQNNVKTYTMEEVATHGSDPNNYVDCWTVIHDKVYDITKYTDSMKHPGGESIFEACGKDATELFETRPIGTGTPHSANARSILNEYYIGDLKK